jgi:type IV secretory pathway protease TraF
MPGQTACFRCGSLLEAKAGTMEVHPPRAPAWKKPFRRVAHRLRHYRALRAAEGLARQSADRTAYALGRIGLPGPSRSADAPRWGELWLALRDAAVALALSIVPGLAHALRHQFGAISGYVLSWFVSLVMGLLFFGQALGTASMASAFVLHAWIAMDAVVATKRFKEKMTALQKIGWRLCGIGFLVILLYAAYNPIQRAAGFAVGNAGVAVPAQPVEVGDSILCRYLAEDVEPPPLKRGDLVLVRVREIYGEGEGQRGMGGNYVGEAVGQLIALPGDQVALTPKGFIVNGRALDVLKFAIPASLKGQSARLALGKDEYFVTMEWRIGGHGVVNVAGVAAMACIFLRPDVLARGVMRWSPIWRRAFLKEFE